MNIYDISDKMYVSLIKKILRNRGEPRRKYANIFLQAKPYFVSGANPHFQQVVNGYSENSIASQKSRLKKLSIIDGDGFFTDGFFTEYKETYHQFIAPRAIEIDLLSSLEA